MIGYILPVLAFLMTFFALKKDSPKLSDRLSVSMLTTAALIVLFSMYATYQQDQKSKQLEKMVSQSERLIYSGLVSCRGGKYWKAPVKIPGGSIIEFHGFDEPVTLWRDNLHTIPVAASSHGVIRVAFVSMLGSADGVDYEWSIAPTSSSCSGLVYVYSTPEIQTGEISHR